MHTVHERVRAVAHATGGAEWAELPGHVERLERLVAALPPAIWHRVSKAVRTKYELLEGRYGRTTAVAIVAAGVVGSAVPLPGTGIVAVAPVIGLAELHHQLVPLVMPAATALADHVALTAAEVQRLGNNLVLELTGLHDPDQATQECT
jgi:hypothetical protein